MAEVTVHVPDERLAAFYQVFGLWLEGLIPLPKRVSDEHDVSPGSHQGASDGLRPWGNDEDDVRDATELWAKYPKKSRAMFELLMESPGRKYTGDEIAERLGIKHGARGVAGVLSWPGRYGAEIGRGLPLVFKVEDHVGYYSMPPERVELFRAARTAYEERRSNRAS